MENGKCKSVTNIRKNLFLKIINMLGITTLLYKQLFKYIQGYAKVKHEL